MRIVSLLPAATEILGVLGLMDQVVGVSHECDFPEAAGTKPRVTASDIHGRDVASADIDRWVSDRLGRGEDLFTLDETQLRQLRPDLILTQMLCDVCAPAYRSVTALAQTLPGPPRVLNLEPACLADILRNIEDVAEATAAQALARKVLEELRERIDFVRKRAVTATTRPRVGVIEWLDPIFCSGHWTPELVTIAAGEEVLGRRGEDSVRVSWADVLAAQPEILIVACCGQDARRALADWERIQDRPEIQALPAVRDNKVFVADGNAYFSRPGPRIVDSLEIVAEIVHPELFAGRYPERGVRHAERTAAIV